MVLKSDVCPGFLDFESTWCSKGGVEGFGALGTTGRYIGWAGQCCLSPPSQSLFPSRVEPVIARSKIRVEQRSFIAMANFLENDDLPGSSSPFLSSFGKAEDHLLKGYHPIKTSKHEGA